MTPMSGDPPYPDRAQGQRSACSARGTVRGETLHEVQEALARPWSSEEVSREGRLKMNDGLRRVVQGADAGPSLWAG